MQDVDRKRKYPRRDPTTAEAKAQYAAVQQQVMEWHEREAQEKTLVVAPNSSSRERIVAYNALEALNLGEQGSRGFYVEKVLLLSFLPQSMMDVLKRFESNCRGCAAVLKLCMSCAIGVSNSSVPLHCTP